MKTLLIIDPQNDFITGTLPVEGAEEQLTRLAEHLHHIACDHIIVTMDCHPLGHVSFAPQGGPWPSHCEKYSDGAAILPVLFDALRTKSATTPIHFVEKGTAIDKDEYSAFETEVPDILRDADEIIVCGVAGDVCVHTTISDLIHHGLRDRIRVITDASPSLDGGEKLSTLIRTERLIEYTLDTLA